MCRRDGPLPQLRAGFWGQVSGGPARAIEQLSIAASDEQSYQFLPLMSLVFGEFHMGGTMLVFLSQALEPLNSKTPRSESISVHIPIAFTTMVGVPDPSPGGSLL